MKKKDELKNAFQKEAGEKRNREDQSGKDHTGEDCAGKNHTGKNHTGKDQALAEILSYYGSVTAPSSQENIVSMLREIQELYGCISNEHRQMAAEAAGVGLPVVDCIMKLYKTLKPAPYQHRITVCTGSACLGHKKQEKLLESLKKELGIKGKIPASGALSFDSRILLETRSCLKRCRTAPNVMVDGKLAEPGDKREIVKKLLGEIKE